MGRNSAMTIIEIISVPVTNQEKSKEFYLKLGFVVIAEIPLGNALKWLQLGVPGQSTSISLVSKWPYEQVSMAPGSLQGIILQTDDIQGEAKKLKELGIEFGVVRADGFKSGEIDQTPWGEFTHFTDPDGNGLSWHQSETNPRQSSR